MRSIISDSALVRLVCALSLLLASSAMAEGGGVHGGGDICEDRIQQIRDDLKSWIYQGGAQGLSLPQEISANRYADMMLDQIKVARLKCVGARDKGYPVTIGNTPKVCKFSFDQTGSQITCDYVKFLATSESDQYVLIHHEYAGLAGVEVPNRDDSHYDVSNQISEFLEEQMVKRLAVKSVSSELKVGSRVVIDDDQYNTKSAKITGVSAEKNTYYQVWLCGDSGQFCAERTIGSVSIKGSEIGSLSGVKKGQKAVCKIPYGPFGSTFEGRVAHIYSNGFVEIDIPTNSVALDKFNSESFAEATLYWSSIPGARETPRFAYECYYK